MITNITANNGFRTQPMTKAVTFSRDNNIAFCGVKKKIALGTSGLVLGGIVAMKSVLIAAFLTGQNEKNISKHVGWDYNTQVLSSVGQNSFGANNEKVSYANILVDMIAKNKAKTPEAANDSLSKTGYKININDITLRKLLTLDVFAQKLISQKTLFPEETPGQRLNIFNKEETGKKRYVLIVSEGDEERFPQNAKLFEAKIKDTYKISDSNIVNISAFKDSDFEKGIDSISKKITDTENSELLVLYSGHGGSFAQSKAAEKVEGDMEGVILDELTESKVKNIFNEKLQGIKTLFVVDACNSGAWIANKAKTVSKFSKLA